MVRFAALSVLLSVLPLAASAAEPAPAAEGNSAPCRIGVDLADQWNRTMVTRVYPGSPAARAGIKRGDTIIMVGGVTTMSSAQVLNELERFECGEKLDMTLLNLSKSFMPRSVQIAREPVGKPAGGAPAANSTSAPDCRRWGIRGVSLGMTIAEAKAACPGLKAPVHPHADIYRFDCPTELGKELEVSFIAAAAGDGARVTSITAGGEPRGILIGDVEEALRSKFGPETGGDAEGGMAYFEWDDPGCGANTRFTATGVDAKTGKPLGKTSFILLIKSTGAVEAPPSKEREDAARRLFDSTPDRQGPRENDPANAVPKAAPPSPTPGSSAQPAAPPAGAQTAPATTTSLAPEDSVPVVVDRASHSLRPPDGCTIAAADTTSADPRQRSFIPTDRHAAKAINVGVEIGLQDPDVFHQEAALHGRTPLIIDGLSEKITPQLLADMESVFGSLVND